MMGIVEINVFFRSTSIKIEKFSGEHRIFFLIEILLCKWFFY